MTSSLFFISKAVKEGPLKKKSPHKLGQTKWSNRYVVLYEDALVYYQSKDAQKPRGVVPLQYVITATAILDTEPLKPGKSEVAPNSRFEVAIRCTPSMKMFHWAALSEQDALSWVQEIKKISELVKAAQARDPYEAFCGPPSPRFWKDVVGLGVARARAAKEKAKADEKSPTPIPIVTVGTPRAPRSASAPHSGTPPPRDSVTVIEEGKNGHARNSSGEILYSPVVSGGVLKLGPLSQVPQAPVLVGVLSKRSPRGLKLWQKRYFSLFADLLIYSKSEGSPVLGAVPLECVESVSIIEITEGASLFNIVISHKGTANPKTLEIMASTPQECTMWVEALHYACPNTMYHKKQVGATPRSRNSSIAGMVRSGSQGVIEFDLSTPYVDRPGPESPTPRLMSAKTAPPPPSFLACSSSCSASSSPCSSGSESPFSDLTLSGATSSDGKPPPKPPPRKLSTYGSFTSMHTTIPPTLYSALTPMQEKKLSHTTYPPYSASSSACSSCSASSPSSTFHAHAAAASSSSVAATNAVISPSLIPRASLIFQNNLNNSNNNKDLAPSRPPPPPPFRKSTSFAPPTIIDDVFPSPFTPVAAPIFAPVKQKLAPSSDSSSTPLPLKQEAPRVVAPVLTSAALPDPMEDAPPDYTSSSDDDNSEASLRESVNFAAICTPESITTVTTYYRHKSTDSSDSEDYVLIDLDGAEDDGDRLEEKLPAFLPQAMPAARKASSASWTAIHHNPAEYSPKLAVTKLSPDTVDRDLVLSVGPSRWRSISQKDGSPSPRDSTPPAGTRGHSPSRSAKIEPSLAHSDYPTSILYHVNENQKNVRASPSKIPPPPRLSEIHRHALLAHSTSTNTSYSSSAAAAAGSCCSSSSSLAEASSSSISSLRQPSTHENKTSLPTEILKPGEGQKGKEGISVGDYVELGGLSASKFNAQKGVVLFTELGRCEIRLTSGDVVRIKEVNLKKIPKPKVTPQHRTSASTTELGLDRRGSGSGSGRLVRNLSSSKLARTEAKAQAAQRSKGAKLGDHKRALSQPPKANKVVPITDAEVPKPFLADEDGTGTDDDDDDYTDDTDEQLAGIQSAPEWVKNRLYSADMSDKPSSKSASDPRSKLLVKDKLLKR